MVFPVPIDLVRPFLAGDGAPAPSTSSETVALRGRSDMESLIAGWTSVRTDAERADK
ncbi:hypothetical protein [Rhodococcus sp. W8901]|uniref:hypothetical protein n=1 Tax=Rhodococcus sp. W8901 TaxID=2742603 RepID=UPI0020C6AF2E|nr:hypothetical protein [Rhodococcus sp. W8901]